MVYEHLQLQSIESGEATSIIPLQAALTYFVEFQHSSCISSRNANFNPIFCDHARKHFVEEHVPAERVVLLLFGCCDADA